MCVDKVCGDKVYVCVCVWTKCVWTKYLLRKCVLIKYVWTMCVDKVCGDKVCVDEVCGEEEEAAEEAEEPGIQNQKQEPHTKMWGITLLRVIPTMTFIHFLTGKSSGILSDISSDILFGISSGI